MLILNSLVWWTSKSGRIVPLFLIFGAFISTARAGESGILTTKNSVARFYQDGTRLRLEWQAPPARRGDVLVDNGENVWLFHRAQNSVTQTNSPGRVARLGNVGTLSGVRNIDIPAAKFSFSVPEGASFLRIDGRLYASLASAKRAAIWMREPQSWPANFAFESAIVGKDSVWLRFSDGKTRFSLFQQRADDGILSLQKVEGGWFWKNNGVRFLLSGASEEQARFVANAMN